MRGSTYLPGVAALFLAAVPSAAQQVVDFAAVVRRVQPAVVTLRSLDEAGRMVGLGSGFVVDGGRIVTNAHVVEGAARVEVYGKDDERLGSTDHVEALSEQADLAVLPPVAGTTTGLRLAAADPEVGEAILAIGSPQGLTHTVSDGLVSAMRTLEGRRWIQISAPLSEGSSGGPVLNKKGEVVGVSVAILTEGQNLNFAIPAADVRALLAAPRARTALGAPRRQKQEYLAARSGAARVPDVRVGETREGALQPSDTRMGNGAYVDTYRLTGRAGETVTITVRSSEFDAFVVVGDPERDRTPLAYDDDSGGGYDARVTVRLPRDGAYSIGIASAGGKPTGSYTLSVHPATGSTASAGTAAQAPKW